MLGFFRIGSEVWDMRKEILCGYEFMCERQINPTPDCMVNSTECYGSWECKWFIYLLLFFSMQVHPLTKDVKYHTCTCIQTFIFMCMCFWFWSDCLQDSCWCVCTFFSYLIVHKIAVILFGMINVNESRWWLLRSPCTIGSECTSSVCLQYVFYTVYKVFIVKATPLEPMLDFHA